MKLLIVADLHYALPQFDWVLAAAPGYDLVIIAGDLLEVSSSVDPGAQIVVVLNYIKRLRQKTRLLVCSGNHDLDALGADGEKQAQWMSSVRALGVTADGESVMIDDTLVTVCPWWDGPLTQAAIASQLDAAAALRTGEWIWVNHAPPTNSPISWTGYRHYGDAMLLEWIDRYQPNFIFSGHVHEAPFSRNGSWVDRLGDTWMFNAGRQIGPVPTIIAINTEINEAAWLSFEGAESVRLDLPLTRPIAALAAMPDWLVRV